MDDEPSRVHRIVAIAEQVTVTVNLNQGGRRNLLEEHAKGVEQEGIDKVWQHQRKVDLVVLVLDGQQDWSASSQQLLESCSEPLVVYNKSDLIKSVADKESVVSEHSIGRPPGILTSAVTGDGLDCLIDEMLRHLVPVAPGLDDAVPFTEAQSRLVGEVLELLKNGQVQRRCNKTGPEVRWRRLS